MRQDIGIGRRSSILVFFTRNGCLVLSLIVGEAHLGAQTCDPAAVKKVTAATVFITAKETSATTGVVTTREGSGFVVSPSGFILTARHVVEPSGPGNSTTITAALADRYAAPSPVTLIGKNDYDIALLKFKDTSKTYDSVFLGTPSTVAVGTALCAVGFPAGLDSFLATGSMSGTGGERGFWLTNMSSNAGDSGAPVFLASEAVVAIKIGGYKDVQNVNLIAPRNFFNDLLLVVPDLPVRPAFPPGGGASTTTGSSSLHPMDSVNPDFQTLFNNSQMDELQLANLGQNAFDRRNYDWAIKFLEQAHLVQRSKVWMARYPLLAVSYLLGKNDKTQFERILGDMFQAMMVPNTFLYHAIPRAQCLAQLNALLPLIPAGEQPFVKDLINRIGALTSI